MFKKIIFNIVAACASELEVETEVLFSSNREEVASARYAVVGALSEYFSDAQLPDNWLTRLLGDVGTIRITAEDIDRLASELIA